MELWKDVCGYDDYYQASSLGRVRSKDRVVVKFSAVCNKVVRQKYKGRELSLKPNAGGYIYVHISIDKAKENLHVGRAVLLAFCGKPLDNQECCHNDGNPSNNKIENLRWGTHLENNRDRIKHGTYKRGTAHHFSKFDNDLICSIKNKSISKDEALGAGVSNTHYYRILKGER